MADEKNSKEGSNIFHSIMKASVTAPKKEKQYIPNEVLNAFTESYEKGDIWKIASGDYWLNVFLYKADQIKVSKDLPKYNEIKKDYLKLVNKYLDPNIKEIGLSFDSKERFEKKFNGNWYDYYH